MIQVRTKITSDDGNLNLRGVAGPTGVGIVNGNSGVISAGGTLSKVSLDTFDPTDIANNSLWLDAADSSSVTFLTCIN